MMDLRRILSFDYRRAAEMATWVGLFLLLPGTALGYFAEGSLPGQPLYPVKRGIENIVLMAQSFNADAKALYEVELTNQRLAESTKLLASKKTTYNFDDVYLQIAAARASISTISDSTDRKVAEQRLVDTISLYQDQLSSIQSTSGVTNETENPTPTTAANSHTSSNTNSQSPTNTPTPDNNQSNGNADTSQQIDTLNTQLEQIKDQLTSSDSLTSPTPTPTATPFQTTSNTSTFTAPTPTPTPVPHLPVFTYPDDQQSFYKGEDVGIKVTVLNGNKNDKLTVYVDGSKLCTGSYEVTCSWTVPSHYSTSNDYFTIMAQVLDIYGRYTSKSIIVYLKSGDGSYHSH